jgi:hypothetical protein
MVMYYIESAMMLWGLRKSAIRQDSHQPEHIIKKYVDFSP